MLFYFAPRFRQPCGASPYQKAGRISARHTRFPRCFNHDCLRSANLIGGVILVNYDPAILRVKFWIYLLRLLNRLIVLKLLLRLL